MASPTQSYILDGVGDYITLADNAGFDVSTYVSIGMWIVRDYDDLNSVSELLYRQASYDVKIEAENQIRFTISGAGVLDSKGKIPADKPVFVVCTAEESGTSLVMKIYLGGILDNSVTIPTAAMPAANANALSIGGGAAGANPLKGTISSIFLTSDAITAAEVKTIFTSSAGQATGVLDNLVIDIDTEGDLVNAGSAGNGTAQGNAAARTYMHLFQALKDGSIIIPEAETGYVVGKPVVVKGILWDGENIADGDQLTLKDRSGTNTLINYYAKEIITAAGDVGVWKEFPQPLVWGKGFKVSTLSHGTVQIWV